MKRALLSASVLIVALAPRLGSRNVPTYGYDDLFARSDLVVVARPITKTRDTSERRTLRDWKPPMLLIGVKTELHAELILKGSKRERFTLHHFRGGWKPDAVILESPRLLKLDPNKHADYLLFLVREPDGRFAPTGGQDDVIGVSVWELSEYAE